MNTLRLVVAALVILIMPLPAGINWKTIWLEPNPVVLPHPGASLKYTVKGIDGGDNKGDLTYHPELQVTSSDPSAIEVDAKAGKLVAKKRGPSEIRISFSECTSLIRAYVRDDSN